jgi:hypothetical protein
MMSMAAGDLRSRTYLFSIGTLGCEYSGAMDGGSVRTRGPVVRVERHIRLESTQRWSGPSASSRSFETQS